MNPAREACSQALNFDLQLGLPLPAAIHLIAHGVEFLQQLGLEAVQDVISDVLPENLFLQPGKQCLFQDVAPQAGPVRADSVTTLEIRRTSIALAFWFPAASRNNLKVCAAQAAFEKSGEKIRGVHCGRFQQTASFGGIEIYALHEFFSLLHCAPQFIADDAEVRSIGAMDRFPAFDHSEYSPASLWVASLWFFAPKHLADIALVVKHHAHGRWAPRARQPPILRLWRQNAIGIELPRNCLQAIPCRVQFKDRTHDLSLGLVNFEARSTTHPIMVFDFDAAIPETAATRMQTSAQQALHSTAHPVCRVTEEKLVHEPTRHQQKLKLFVCAIDPLRDETDFHPGKIETLAQVQNIRLFPRETARVFEENRIKWARLRFSRGQQAGEARTVQSSATDSFIGITVFLFA